MRDGSSLAAIQWPALIKGTLIRRYKRFMADVRLPDGRVVTAYCPNSGSKHNNPRRKLRYTWELIDMGTSLVGVNTLIPNRLVKKGISIGMIEEVARYKEIRTEVAYGKNSRVDILLQNESELCYVEVKNCTLVEKGVALFPDAVTARGRKHLVDLQEEVRKGPPLTSEPDMPI